MSRWKFIHDPQPDRADTGLRFTDVLFGFVIKELFTRLSAWENLSGVTRAHLITGTVLVLGSYIGFRKSLHRGAFRLQFVNLPLWRFMSDQAMVALYFRFATVTPADGSPGLGDMDLIRTDLNLLMLIFALYVAWDLLSLAITNGKYKIRDTDFQVCTAPSGDPLKYDLVRLCISGLALAVFVSLRVWVEQTPPTGRSALVLEGGAIAVLVFYRVFKDTRQSPSC